MDKNQKRNAIILVILLILVIATPLGTAVYFNNKTTSNNNAIRADQVEMKKLAAKRNKKRKTIYEHEQNIKQLNKRLHQATNTLIQAQNVLMQNKHSAISSERVNQAERMLASVTAKDLSFSNDLLFDLGDKALTLKPSYPSQIKVSQDQVPIMIHAYDKKDREVGFVVLFYDTNDHVFNNYATYSVSYLDKQRNGIGTDYKSFKKAQAAQQKADAERQAREQRQARLNRAKAEKAQRSKQAKDNKEAKHSKKAKK